MAKKSVKKEKAEEKKDEKVEETKVEEPEKKEEQTEKEKEKQIKHQNNILKGMLIIVGVIVVIIVAWFVIAQSVRTFEYKDLDFEIVQEGELIFYRTGLPTMYQGQLTEYSFYLRNDARDLDKSVPFTGVLDLKSTAVLNMESDFSCEGKGVIAVANLLKLYKFVDVDVLSDENATCDPESRYTFIQILEGNETKIEMTGQSCYNIYINNCEILEGTERMMIETLNKVRSVTPDYDYNK
jgi:hypothetical protein